MHNDKVICKICDKSFRIISNTHLWQKHNISIETYKALFPDADLTSESTKELRSQYSQNKTYEELYGAERAQILKKQRSISITNIMKDEKQRKLRVKSGKYKRTPEILEKLSKAKSKIWNNYQQEAFDYYGEECQRCGSVENLVVHHVDFNNFKNELGNHDIENLMVLCKSCHAKLHNSFNKGHFAGISKVEKGMVYILEGLRDEFGLDLSDVNFIDTPKRVARSFYELCSGIDYENSLNEIINTSFPTKYDGMIVTNCITHSLCPHHFLPVEYNIQLGYIPKEKCLGVSKLTRICKLLSRRPVLQEDLTQDIVDVFKRIGCDGSIVVVKGKHLCMVSRGIKEQNSLITTSAVNGSFENHETRDEFFNIIDQKL